jgi:hypothetical protein
MLKNLFFDNRTIFARQKIYHWGPGSGWPTKEESALLFRLILAYFSECQRSRTGSAESGLLVVSSWAVWGAVAEVLDADAAVAVRAPERLKVGALHA